MRAILVTLAILALLAAPVMAQDMRPKVWRWPGLPTAETLPQQPGSVSVIVRLRGATDWVIVDGIVIAPPDGLDVCGPTLPMREAG